ncbi:hypothetical protein C2845_PM07G40260 [Panicum miliaceum]|uniref:Uncharacterized protein n=1 Tax=Panicum miliaceum TaxID=4540 RepID=A0A3L6SPT3_PANMI|nr:hypothetical protein C2845_PM07G40260 [Panicum miliaceum]
MAAWITVAEYFSTRQSVESLAVPGHALPQAAAAAPGAPAQAPPPCVLPTMEAQRVIFGILSECNEVFASLRCFSAIDDDTFLVFRRTGAVMISKLGVQQLQSSFPDEATRRAQMTQNLRSLGSLIRREVFANQSPVPVVEMEDGVLHMLQNDDVSMWPVIRQHTSLLPIFNRVDCLLRLYDELVNVVADTNLTSYGTVLRSLVFPANWRTLITQNSANSFLSTNTYLHRQGRGRRTISREEEAYHVLRYHRNPSAHGLEGSVPPGPVHPSSVPRNPVPASALRLKFQARLPAQPGDVPVGPTYERWHVGLLHYTAMPMVLHSFQRAMHLIGHLERLRLDYLFAYPTHRG